jgi:hypothetical protein
MYSNRIQQLENSTSAAVMTQTPPAPVTAHGFVCVPGFLAAPVSAYLPCMPGQVVHSQDILRMAYEAARKSVRRSWYPLTFSNN